MMEGLEVCCEAVDALESVQRRISRRHGRHEQQESSCQEACEAVRSSLPCAGMFLDRGL
jgi:hypothetical protein